MTPSVPKKTTPSLPDVMQGEIYRQVGKYARGAVLYAFEQVGGPEGLSDWAKENPDEFYTKLFPKIIARESEVQHVRGVDDLMDLLDGDYEIIDDGSAPAPIEDAEILSVDEAMDSGSGYWPVEDAEATFNTSEFDGYGLDFDVDDHVDFEL